MNVLVLQEFADIDVARGDLNDRARSLLESLGWKYTCDTPGSMWLYEKTLDDGRALLVGQTTAIDIEINLAGG